MIIFVDGGLKPSSGPYGSIRIETDNGELREIIRISKFNYKVETNNQCEYAVLFEALLYISSMIVGIKNLTIYSDSQLMIRQLNKEYKIRDENLAEWAKIVWELLAGFKDVKLIHVPRKIIVEKLGH